MPDTLIMTLILDDDDYSTIQAEIEHRKERDGGDPILPEGGSNLDGSLIAEMVRDLAEYRATWEREHPVKG